MGIQRIPMYPRFSGDVEGYCKTLSNDLNQEAVARIQDFDILKLNNVAWRAAGEFPSVEIAVANIGTTETVLLIQDTEAIADDLATPSTMTLRVVHGGSLSIATGKTVTISGHVEAGLYQIFEGADTVAFGTGSAKEVYPQWWGENTTPGTTDMTAAIQLAFDSVGSCGRIVIPGGKYYLSGGITITKWPITVEGAGMYNTIFDVSGWSGTGSQIKLFYFDGSASPEYVGISPSASAYSGFRGGFIGNFGIEGSNTARTNGVIGIDSDNFYHEGLISKIRFYKLGTAIDLYSCWGVHLEDNKISGCYDGITLAFANGVNLSRNYINNNTNSGIIINNGDGVTIQGGVVENMASGSTGGVLTYGNINGLTIEGVDLEGNEEESIKLEVSGVTRNVRIVGNLISYLSTYAGTDHVIDLSDSENILIEYNTIRRATQCAGKHAYGTGRHINIGNNRYQYYSGGWTDEQADLSLGTAKFVSFEHHLLDLEYADEFIGDSLSAIWNPAGDTVPTCEQHARGGVVLAQTAATINTTSILSMNSRIIDPDNECDVFIRARVDQIDNAKAQYLIGIEYQAVGGGDHYIYFENGATNWTAKSDDGTTTAESTDTGIAVSTNYVEFRIKCLSGHAYFFMNGNFVADHSSKVPTANNDFKLYCKTLENVSHSIRVDRVRVIQKRIATV